MPKVSVVIARPDREAKVDETIQSVPDQGHQNGGEDGVIEPTRDINALRDGYEARIAGLERTLDEVHKDYANRVAQVYRPRIAELEASVEELHARYRTRIEELQRTIQDLAHDTESRFAIWEREKSKLSDECERQAARDREEINRLNGNYQQLLDSLQASNLDLFRQLMQREDEKKAVEKAVQETLDKLNRDKEEYSVDVLRLSEGLEEASGRIEALQLENMSLARMLSEKESEFAEIQKMLEVHHVSLRWNISNLAGVVLNRLLPPGSYSRSFCHIIRRTCAVLIKGGPVALYRNTRTYIENKRTGSS